MAGGKSYRDWVDITPSEAYKLFLDDPDSFNTSAPTPNDCFQAFKAAAKIASNILCITISKKLSRVYDSAINARELAKMELPETTIEIIDSTQATSSEGMVALAAARIASAGQDMAAVIQAAETVMKKVNVVMFLDTIKHVYRSGRIPKIASQLGSMLSVKPILTISEVVRFAGIARSRKKGVERILQMMKEKVGEKAVHVAVTHAYALEEAEKLKERVVKEFNCVETWLSEFSPVMGYACGTGTVGLSFYTEE
jgi:DegV family protein with EDD domain